MKKFKSLWIVVALVVVLAIFAGTTYNGLVRSEEDVNQAWSQVETNYQRRADLIPNLVETVKGYSQHESEVFTNIAKLRSGYQEAKTPAEYTALDQQLRTNIQIAVEAYPELKANENFLSLQDEISGTENRIAIARKDYNTVATRYNKSVRVFPRTIFAHLFGFGPKELFQAEAGSEKAPKVDFGSGAKAPDAKTAPKAGN